MLIQIDWLISNIDKPHTDTIIENILYITIGPRNKIQTFKGENMTNGKTYHIICISLDI